MDNSVGLIGVFDLFHEGHINLLKKASKLGYVYVGVVKDKAVKKQKGDNRPIFNENHRLAIIKECQSVIDAFLIDDFDVNLLRKQIKHITDLNIVIRGEDQDHVKGFKELKEQGVLIISLDRTEGVSTTALVDKMK